MVNFPTRISDCDSRSRTLSNLLISSDTSICSTVAFPPLGNSDNVVISVSIDLPSIAKRDAQLTAIFMLIDTAFMIT